MTSAPLNPRNPTTKRILREAHELSSSSSLPFHAAPLPSNLHEFHFTLPGPPSSPFETGLYHGRIVLPPAYPLRPPSFRFLTPNGRFEVNTEICLSISGHHEETWQPAWGIRTALLGVRGLMGEDGRGQLGGLDLGGEGRRELARRSRGWVCGVCGVSNEEIVAEMRRRVEKGKGKVLAEEGEEEGLVVPEEMRFVSRQELDEKAGQVAGSPEAVEATVRTGDAAPQTSRLQPRASPATTAALAVQEQLPPWIDKAIVWSAVALVTLILKRLLFG